MAAPDPYTMTCNPVVGCLNECYYCYARALVRRFAKGCRECEAFVPHWHVGRLEKLPTKPRRDGTARRVFIGSACDLWSDGVRPEWRVWIWEAARKVQHDWWFCCSKRPERIAIPDGLARLWVGTTLTGLGDEEGRLPQLAMRMPAIRRYLSAEPLLGPEVAKRLEIAAEAKQLPAWVMVGPLTGTSPPSPRNDTSPPDPLSAGGEGENDRGTRAMLWEASEEWAQEVVDVCQRLGVPVWVKQAAAEAWPGVTVRREMPGVLTAGTAGLRFEGRTGGDE